MKSSFKTSPAFRAAVRSLVVALLGYIATVLAAGFADGFDWQKFVVGLLGTALGAAYAVLGVTTPIEPFIGNKPAGVVVPQPTAEPVPDSPGP